MNTQNGIISKWDETKDFGFITPQSGGKPIFFHINAYSRSHKRPVENLRVQYSPSTDQKGRACAVNVTPIQGHKELRRDSKQKIISLILLASAVPPSSTCFRPGASRCRWFICMPP